jgi:acetate---CoA ligase (ADP-forming)
MSQKNNNKKSMLNLKKSFELLKGLSLAKYKTIESEKDLSKIEFPYFIKISTPEHKIEKKAVKKCQNLNEAKKCFKDFKKRFPNQEIIIQEAIEGIEMIIGLKKDTVFNKIIMIGFGGTFTEIINDVSFKALPITEKDINEMLNELKMSDILKKRKKYNIKSLKKQILKISKINAQEIDINPIIINEKNAYIIDARIKL